MYILHTHVQIAPQESRQLEVQLSPTAAADNMTAAAESQPTSTVARVRARIADSNSRLPTPATSTSQDDSIVYTGYLTVIDSNSHMLTCELRGLTGHLLSVRNIHLTASPIACDESTTMTCDVVNQSDMSVAVQLGLSGFLVTTREFRRGPFMTHVVKPMQP